LRQNGAYGRLSNRRGKAKDLDGVFAEVRAICDRGGNGSIIGRNTFQRPKDQALGMLGKIIEICQGKD